MADEWWAPGANFGMWRPRRGVVRVVVFVEKVQRSRVQHPVERVEGHIRDHTDDGELAQEGEHA